MLKRRVVATVGLVGTACALPAQRAAITGRQLADSTASRIMAQSQSDVRELPAILRQGYSVQPQAKLDEVADSLAQRAVAFPAILTVRDASTAARYKMAMDAIAALQTAGLGAASGRAGRPYAGAADRLAEISEHGQNALVRAAALDAMRAVVGGSSRAVTLMVQAATSAGDLAMLAMEDLVRIANPDGPDLFAAEPPAERGQTAALLHQLWDQELAATKGALSGNLSGTPIPERRALGVLGAFANKEGWKMR